MNARPWMLRLIIFAATFLTFCRLSSCEFLYWDDESTIRDNPQLNPPTWHTLAFYWSTASEEKTMGLYVPVTYMVWAGLAVLSHHLPGGGAAVTLNPALFHTANVLLHSITAVLVFELLRRLFRSPVPCAIGALLFALHPVQVEAVGWASGTKDLLCGLFSVASLLVYVRSVQMKSWRWFWIGLGLFVIAVLCKPTAVVVPLLAGVVSFFFLSQSIWKTVRSLFPWIVLMIPFLILTQMVQPPEVVSTMPAWSPPFVAADALAFYAAKVVWPADLRTDYGRTPAVILASHQMYFTWIVPAVLAALLLWKWKQARPAVGAAMLFVLPLMPVLGFVPFDFQRFSTTADHYLYLPMFGLAVLVTWTLSAGARSRYARLSFYLSIALLALYSVLSIHQERVWKNTRILFTYDLNLNPRSVRDTVALGYLDGQEAVDLKKAGNLKQAWAKFDSSTIYYKQALALNPDQVVPMLNIALNYRETGRRELGLEMVRRIIGTQPKLAPSDRAGPEVVAKLWEEFDDIPDEITWLEQQQQADPQNRQVADLLAKAKVKGRQNGEPK